MGLSSTWFQFVSVKSYRCSRGKLFLIIITPGRANYTENTKVFKNSRSLCQNNLLWILSFHPPYLMASSDLSGIFFYTFLLKIDLSQKMISSTILFFVADGTSNLLCTQNSCSSCWFLILSSGNINRTLFLICDRLYLPMLLL